VSKIELSVGLIGCGTVGGTFLKVLRERKTAIEEHLGAGLRVVQIAVARPHLPRPLAGDIPVHGDAARIAADERIPILVEASNAPEAADWIAVALARGAVVITANKQALASRRDLLGRLARGDPRLYCEASVAAAVPIVRTLRDSLRCDEVRDLRGVLNGTTNFMLSHIEDNGSFDEALLLAQRAGYAELDPVADLSGADAAAKLAILSTIAWRVPVCASEIATEGIDSSVVAEAQRARRQGRRLRFVAQAHRNGALHASVRPALLPEGDLLARAQGVENVIQIEAALAGTLSWRGPGAGGLATASSLLGDVVCGAAHLIQHTRRSFYGGC